MSGIYFILMLGGLVFFHEFGHFIIARLFKVTVLEFSIGFGPQIGSFRRGDTVYRIGALPLGGYVKMLGADPMADPEENQQPGSFATKPLWQRALVVLAGPAFNLILPLFIFFFLFLGADLVRPAILGTLQPDGVAAKAGLLPGDVIVNIDGEEVEGWWQLSRLVGGNDGTPIEVVVERDSERLPAITMTPKVVTETLVPALGLTREVGRIQIEAGYRQPIVYVEPGSAANAAGLKSWDKILTMDGVVQKRWEYTIRELEKRFKAGKTVSLKVLRRAPLEGAAPGLVPFQLATMAPAVDIILAPGGGDGRLGLRSAEFYIHDITEGSPEWEVGLRVGDEVQTINGRKMSSWGILQHEARSHPKQVHAIVYRRGAEERTVKVAFEVREHKGEFNTDTESVIFGISNSSMYDSPDPVPNTMGVRYALYEMWSRTGKVFMMTAASLGGLFTGRVGIKDMGGPIFIFQAASKTEEEGWEYFFQLMAWLSISLGLINLVPIPLLDGGHLLFFLIEAIRRRPASLRTRQIASYVGFSFIIVLMVLVFKNDISRSWDLFF